MPKSIEDFYQRVYKKSKADEDRLKRKNEILEKAREYYGYDVDIRDTRLVAYVYYIACINAKIVDFFQVYKQ